MYLDLSVSFYTQWVPEAHIPGVNRPWHEAEHAPSCNAQFTINGAVPPLPNSSSWRGTESSKRRLIVS